MRRTSSLPSGVFKRVEPEVEQALAGSVADVFLSHMTAPPPSLQERATRLDPPARDSVDPVEIDEFAAEYFEGARVPPPGVEVGLGSERMWVLADLAIHGGGRARELATRELRVFVKRLSNADFGDVDLLRALIGSIESRGSAGKQTILLQVLLASAREALRALEQGEDSE